LPHFLFQLQQAIARFVHYGHRVLVFGRRHLKNLEVYKHSGSAHTGWFFTQNVLVMLHTCFLFVLTIYLAAIKIA